MFHFEDTLFLNKIMYTFVGPIYGKPRWGMNWVCLKRTFFVENTCTIRSTCSDLIYLSYYKMNNIPTGWPSVIDRACMKTVQNEEGSNE